MKPSILPIAGALALLSTAALADTPVSAVTDLNVRAGPGPQYPVTGVLMAGQAATLRGCLENSKWCAIDDAGGQGWVYSDYVTAEFGSRHVVVTQLPPDADIAIVAPPADIDRYPSGGYTAAIVPGDPVAPIDEPPPSVRTYIGEHTLEPVYLEGEVVTGSVLPEDVVLGEIPDYDYRYVYVNGQPALIDPQTRRIVYVVR